MTSTTKLSRDHHVSLRRQLAVGLEAAIRDGHLETGSRLPSSREMARRLGVHRSTVTAAYARLRRRGWVVGDAGSRPRVEPPADSPDWAAPASRAVGQLLADARRHGVPRAHAIREVAAVVGAVAESCTVGHAPVLHLFEPRAGLRMALAAELRVRAGVRVEAHWQFPVGLARRGAPIALRCEMARRVSRLWSGTVDLIPLRLAGGTRERGLVRRTVRRGLVSLVSVSRTVRGYASDLAAREFCRGVSFLALSPDEHARLVRVAAASRLILCDEPSRSRLPVADVPTTVIELVSRDQISSLSTYLRRAGSSANGMRPGT